MERDYLSLLDDYISYLRFIKGYSTVYCYLTKTVIVRYLRGRDDFGDWDYDDVLDLIYDWVELGLTDSTINNYISRFSGFCNFLVAKSVISLNPFYRAKRRRVSKKLPQTLSFSQFKAICNFCWNDTVHDREIKGIIMVIISYGLRISEALSLKKKDFNFYTATIHLKKGKGNKDRIVPILHEDIYYFKDMLLAKSSDDFAFNQKTLSVGQVRRKIKAMIYKEIGLCNVNPHKLRHTIATLLLSNGVSLLAIATLLGHKSIKTTQIYTHLSLSDYQSAYKAAFQRDTCQLPPSKKNLSIDISSYNKKDIL